MFGAVGTTPYDLRLRLFGIPVTVSPWFWLAAVITGWMPGKDGPNFGSLAIWIFCFFISILVHEMGHALTALAFGWPPQVYLYGFGGLAVYRPTAGRATWKSVLISFAGPGAGFFLFGVTTASGIVLLASGWAEGLPLVWHQRLADFFEDMFWINVLWGLVNLVPVLPLDGGRVVEALLSHFRPWDGPRLAAIVSVVVALLVAVGFFVLRNRFGTGTYPAFLFGLLAFMNIQSLQTRGPW
jgi:Zn-dependent protease